MSEGKSKGCFFYGCLTFIVLIVAIAVGVYFGTRKAMKLAMASFTDTAPVTLPKVNLSEAQRQDLLNRFGKLSAESAAGKASEKMVLNNDELNGLLLGSPEMKNYQQQAYFQIETNTLKAQVSLPLDEFEIWRSIARKLTMPELKGLYLNGTATLDASITNGELKISTREITAKGKLLPSSLMANLRQQNFAASANTNTELRPMLQKIDKLDILDGHVVIEFKH